MARRISVPKPVAAALAPNRALSPGVRAAVEASAMIENTVLPPEQRTGTSILSINTDAEGLAYIATVHERIPRPSSDKWTKAAAAGFGLLIFLFLVSLVIASLFGRSIPPDSRLLVIAALAVGIALSLGFLGGTASVSGRLERMPLGIIPIAF